MLITIAGELTSGPSALDLGGLAGKLVLKAGEASKVSVRRIHRTPRPNLHEEGESDNESGGDDGCDHDWFSVLRVDCVTWATMTQVFRSDGTIVTIGGLSSMTMRIRVLYFPE